ncbi:DUF952 domain-containing protein [Candidatus Sumerlaeota bacterium]|nr:DUF952 domain-containing protein [Candidatus Sumerlaeota bacterium]
MIYHITFKVLWEQAMEDGFYRTKDLDHTGFIHCSDKDQVLDVAHRLFKGQFGLVLLEIDPSKLYAELVYENLNGNGDQQRPHIYGPLNIEAVVKAHTFKPSHMGAFTLPAKLSD